MSSQQLTAYLIFQVIQKIFVEGMYKHLYLTKETMDQLFPHIDTLIDLHFQFLEDLSEMILLKAMAETFACDGEHNPKTGIPWRFDL